MPTLRFATGVEESELRFVEEATTADADRPLEGVHALTPDNDPDPDQIRRHLVVIQAQDPRLSDRIQLARLLSRLKRAQATALAIAQPPTGRTTTAASRITAAERRGIPLLTICHEPATWLLLHRAVTREHHDQLTRTATLHRELLEQIHHLGQPDGTQRLVTWLASTARAHVTVVSPRLLTTAAAPADAHDVLQPAHEEITRLAHTGGIGSAALDTEGHQIRLFTIGDTCPAPVLALAAPAFTPQTNTAIARTLDLLVAQSAIENAARGRARLRQGEESVRQAILQLLMTGHVTDAQRTAAGIAPGVLDTDECRVFVLKTASHTERATVIQQCDDAVGTTALVSACPAFPDEVIVVAPRRTAEHHVFTNLTTVAQHAPRRYLGGSSPHRLADTAQAYLDASRALIVARRITARAHLYITEIQLAHVLDARACAWARTLLAPILDLPDTRRDQLLATLRLGLDFQPAAAARILGTHRNTVARRLAEAAELLDSDLQDIAHRAVIGLALEVRARRHHRVQPAAEPSVGIRSLLDTDEVRRWARQFLEPLHSDRRPLLETLAAWARSNGRVDIAAAALDMNPATVRSHLRQAEHLLQRRLVTGSHADTDTEPDIAGAHDVVLAMATLCDDVVQI
ncbi:helix-turn-helix domain-containing protein [Streptomyces sp. BE20]|uniref:helix-turn-helix domain-containing protein n=1 Tax=Streptomyces sp. BE20 TaxID=3002525 RepID=UPI002E79C1E9|nr:helix-turn-helix domain-containing protein [Streptomyces sp. BE20]MEE1822211.1 helix-turn-helix domain-containing protein [Streptomyces sp. BE20]